MGKGTSRSSNKKAKDMKPEDDLEEEDVVEVEEVVEEEEEDEEEEEEDEEEEEEDEEEEEEPKTMSAAKRRARAKKKRLEMARKKRNRMVAGVIALILIMVIVFSWVYSPPPTDVELIFNADDEFNPGDGLDILISTDGGGMRGYSGPFTISTFVNGTKTYSEEFTMNNGYTPVKLAYNKFLTQNGVYKIEANVGGTKGSTEYEMKNVVEDINFFIGLDYTWKDNLGQPKEGGKTNVSIIATLIRWTGPGENTTVESQTGQEIEILVTPPSGSDQSTSKNLNRAAQYQFLYMANTRGEYEFQFVFKNTHIRTDSPHWTVSKYINIKVNAMPHAEAGPNQDLIALPLVGATARVDASNSFDDGRIVEYEWNFGVYNATSPHYGEDVIVSDKPTAEWTYYDVGDYTVTLNVKDDGYPGQADSERIGSDFLFVRVR